MTLYIRRVKTRFPYSYAFFSGSFVRRAPRRSSRLFTAHLTAESRAHRLRHATHDGIGAGRRRERAPHGERSAAQAASAAGARRDGEIEDVVVGKGAAVKEHDVVLVHYTGTLLDGTKFDSSHDHPGNQPFTTSIPGRVIQGWNERLLGMRVGGRRKLTIPPSLGYGAMPQPKIPPIPRSCSTWSSLRIKGNQHPAPPPMGP